MARFEWHDEEFGEIRRSPGMVAHLDGMGVQWVGRLNSELHAAQAARKQPVEDGYDHHITVGGTRARLYVVASTARAQAHEAKNGSILKLMHTSGLDVNQGTGEFRNPNADGSSRRLDDRGDEMHRLDE